ncbi:hypothetical protein N9W21_04685 [Shewanella sp.]|nr:hypothetical protein [Shewanella sp.]
MFLGTLLLNLRLSMPILKSNLTLALLLVIFVSQIFPTCVAEDVLHVEQNASETTPRFENSLPADQQQACCDNVNTCLHMVEVSEQEPYNGDFHTACHPPVELNTLAKSTVVEDLTLLAISYQNRSDAPPIPPPYC